MRDNLPSPSVLRQLFQYDAETGKLFWRERTPDMFNPGNNGRQSRCKAWNTSFAGKEAGWLATNGYVQVTLMKSMHLSHRIVWAVYYGAWPKKQIDHINGVRSDNRIKNLRDVANVENCKNRAKSARNKSGHVGVYWRNKEKKWKAQIGGKPEVIGLFENLQDAIDARKDAEMRLGYHRNHGREYPVSAPAHEPSQGSLF